MKLSGGYTHLKIFSSSCFPFSWFWIFCLPLAKQPSKKNFSIVQIEKDWVTLLYYTNKLYMIRERLVES